MLPSSDSPQGDQTDRRAPIRASPNPISSSTEAIGMCPFSSLQVTDLPDRRHRTGSDAPVRSRLPEARRPPGLSGSPLTLVPAMSWAGPASRSASASGLMEGGPDRSSGAASLRRISAWLRSNPATNRVSSTRAIVSIVMRTVMWPPWDPEMRRAHRQIASSSCEQVTLSCLYVQLHAEYREQGFTHLMTRQAMAVTLGTSGWHWPYRKTLQHVWR